jgi:hypothetical protein
MRLEEVLEIVRESYPDKDTINDAIAGFESDDPIADLIVSEIREVHDEDAQTPEQLMAVEEVLRRMISDLTEVLDAFEAVVIL